MPGYKPLTLAARVKDLEAVFEKLKDIESKMRTPGVPQSIMNSLEEARTSFVGQVGTAIDKVLAAADVAEWNNRVYCKYMVDTHADTKERMDKVVPAMERLEKQFDDKLGMALVKVLAQAKKAPGLLDQDDVELRSTGMAEQYRNNGWKLRVTEGLKYAPDRKAAYDKREANRLQGIELSTAAMEKKARVIEYQKRAIALEGTLKALGEKASGLDHDLAELRDEVFDFADSAEKQVGEQETSLKESSANATKRLKTLLGGKGITKDDYKPLLLIEPQVKQVEKNARGILKTLKTSKEQLEKRVTMTGMKDRYFKPALTRAGEAITKLEKELDKYETETKNFFVAVEKGKKLK